MQIRRKIKKIPNKQGQDQDFLDFDALIEMMLEEFRKQRKLYQKDLIKQFARHMETQIGQITLNDFHEMVKDALPPNKDFDKKE